MKIIVVYLASIVIAGGVTGCSDMGHEVGGGAGGSLSASTLAVTLAAGGQATVTISGGHPPYVIHQAPDAALATAQFVNPNTSPASLVITAPAVVSIGGTTQVRIRDSHGDAMIEGVLHDEELRINITVSASSGVSFSASIQPIFSNRCGGCHPGGGAPFSLVTGESYANLVNVAATTGPCAGMMRVKPFNADSSALYLRVADACGALMPLGGSAIPQSEQNLIASWINQGASNN